MQLKITARKFKLTDELRNYVEEEVAPFKKYYDGIIDVDVVLGWEKHDRYAEIKIVVLGSTLTATEKSEEMKKSITLAASKMEKQLIKYKERLKDHKAEKFTMMPVSSSEDDEEIENEDF